LGLDRALHAERVADRRLSGEPSLASAVTTATQQPATAPGRVRRTGEATRFTKGATTPGAAAHEATYRAFGRVRIVAGSAAVPGAEACQHSLQDAFGEAAKVRGLHRGPTPTPTAAAPAHPGKHTKPIGNAEVATPRHQ
jgi:hypothetical protein